MLALSHLDGTKKKEDNLQNKRICCGNGSCVVHQARSSRFRAHVCALIGFWLIQEDSCSNDAYVFPGYERVQANPIVFLLIFFFIRVIPKNAIMR